MTITVSPDSTFSPPRVLVTVSTDDTSTQLFNALTVYRVLSAVQTELRTQPSTGVTSALTYDYECPYGQAVTYRAVGTTIESTPVVEWDETWPNAQSWQLAGGIATVSDGVMSFAELTGASGAAAERALTGSTSYLFTLSGLAPGAIFQIIAADSTAAFTVTFSTDGTSVTYTDSSQTSALPVTTATADVSIAVVGTSVTFTVGSSSQNLVRPTDAVMSKAHLQRATAGVWGGEIVVSEYADVETAFDETSDAVTLDAASGWVIHPTTPALSVPVSVTDRTLVGVSAIGDVSMKSQATTHTVLGQADPIISTTGPRLGASFTLTLAARTVAQAAQLAAIVADETPLLFRFPEGQLDWTDGFYAVGDVTSSRFAQNRQLQRRGVQWPLQAVQAPAGGVMNPGWSWAALSAEFGSWAEMSAAFSTWANLAMNQRE